MTLKLWERTAQTWKYINFNFILSDIFKRCWDDSFEVSGTPHAIFANVVSEFPYHIDFLWKYLDEKGYELLDTIPSVVFSKAHVYIKERPALYKKIKKWEILIWILYGGQGWYWEQEWDDWNVPKKVFFAKAKDKNIDMWRKIDDILSN